MIENDNKPLHQPAAPQLGDTRTFHGGSPQRTVDATLPAAENPKGPASDSPVFQDEALAGFSGGASRAPSPSAEKNIFAAPQQETSTDAVGDAPTTDEATPTIGPESTAWTNGTEQSWFVWADGERHRFTVWDEAVAFYRADVSASFMVPGKVEIEGWHAA